MHPIWWLTLFILIVVIVLGLYSIHLHDNYATMKDRSILVNGVIFGLSVSFYVSVLFLTYNENGGSLK